MKVGHLDYGQLSNAVEEALMLDIMDSVSDKLIVVMENYKVEQCDEM